MRREFDDPHPRHARTVWASARTDWPDTYRSREGCRMTSYQFLPPLSDDEILALREDIAQNGMLHPIVVDEKGRILDGHHRAAIAAALGFKPERHVMEGLTEVEKRTLAFRLNTGRRHMDREQRRAVVVASLKADPQLSDRQHARRTGVSHPTVAGIRAELEGTGRLESFTSRLSADGRERPASQPETPARRDPEQLPPEAPVVATPGGPAEDQPSATAEADGQLDAPGLDASGSHQADGGATPEAADSSVEVSGDTSTDGEEGARVPVSRPEPSDAAGAPVDFPAAGAPASPVADDIAQTDPDVQAAELRMRMNQRLEAFYAGIVNLPATRLGEVADDDLLDRIERMRESLNAWADEVIAVRRRKNMRIA